MKRNDENLPVATKKLLQLIDNEFNGNVSDFSRSIGKSQQVVNRLFNIDKRSGKYPTLSASIIQAVCDSLGVQRKYFYEEENDSILNRIKQLIEDTGLSNEEFAQKIGISEIEEKINGKKEFSDDEIVLISQKTNVRFGWIMNGSGRIMKAPNEMKEQVKNDVEKLKNNGSNEFTIILDMYNRFIHQLEDERALVRSELEEVKKVRLSLEATLADVNELKMQLQEAIGSMKNL